MKRMFALVLALMLMLTACGGNTETTGKAPATVNPMNLAEVYTTITKDVTMPEMIALDAGLMLDFCGIKEEYYTQAQVYICGDSLRADEIWLIEAKDEAALEQLKTLAQARLDQKDAESITYSPEQNAIVKKAVTIVAGNYLAVLVSPDVDALAAAYKTAAGIA